MNNFLRKLSFIAAFLCAVGIVPAQAQVAVPKTLVLYDAPPGTEFEKLGMSYAIMLRNLLGHFSADVQMMPVQQYVAGAV